MTHRDSLFNQLSHYRLTLVICSISLLLGACTPPAPLPSEYPVAEPRISTRVYFYPNLGQSLEQQKRDRYECYLWAMDQTGFDPSMAQLAPHQRIRVEPLPPSGQNTAVGAISGAVIGAVIGAPHSSGEGAAIGAIAGALIGASSDTERTRRAVALENRYNLQEQRRLAVLERRAEEYRRAMQACLEGRGYTVK